LDHVRQAACLRKWQPFRCDKEYFHGKFNTSTVLKAIAAVKNPCRMSLVVMHPAGRNTSESL
jgi:hypothetical protein